MSEATVTSKGQVTIPADIRKALGLTAQDRIVFTSLQNGSVIIRAKTRSILDLKGFLKLSEPVPKISIDDMNIGRD